MTEQAHLLPTVDPMALRKAMQKTIEKVHNPGAISSNVMVAPGCKKDCQNDTAQFATTGYHPPVSAGPL
jgi:hypothetical protein